MKNIGLGFAVAGLIIAGTLVGSGAWAQEGGIKAGVLTCNVSSGWGFVFGSTRDLHCTYKPAKGEIEEYSGHITKFGVDIGYSQGGVMVWAVFAPASDVTPGALAGPYGGATAGATVGVGGNVNALVGGFKKSISLQPVSIEGTTGLNVAAGVAEMTLKAHH
ncbi:MAG TPA: DUF992 domain-containing protein [Rhizomicrobium sp.]|nr:DUF992 domain-containing protein [Rhizomicrobium sp.]